MSRVQTRTHRDHVEVDAQLSRLARIAAQSGGSTRRSVLRQEVPLFLRQWGRRFAPHFRAEERASSAGIRRGFPPELAGTEDLRRERDVMDAILDLLRDRRAALLKGEPGAESDVAAAIDDLHVLWHRHVRRLEVLGALLDRPSGGSRG